MNIKEISLNELYSGQWDWGEADAIRVMHENHFVYYIVSGDDFKIIQDQHEDDEKLCV